MFKKNKLEKELSERQSETVYLKKELKGLNRPQDPLHKDHLDHLIKWLIGG